MSDQPLKNTGLRGVKVGHAYTSAVDPEKGVSYLGVPIDQLYNLDVTAVYWGMIHRRWPTPDEFKAFKQEVTALRKNFPLEVCEKINQEQDAHPMEKLIEGLTLVGIKRGRYTTGTPKYLEGVKELVAWTPLLCSAAVSGKTPKIPGEYRTYGQILAEEMGLGKDEARFLDQFAVIHADHGGGNLSTFIAKAAGSGYVDLWFTIAAGMIGLYGERHGKANQNSLAQLLEFQERMKKEGISVDDLVKETFDKGGAMFGFGHAVLRQEDPRAKIFYSLADELMPDSALYQLAKELRVKWPKFVNEVANPTREKEGKSLIQNPYPNVDQLSGAVLWELGFRDPRSFTVLFALGRMPCIGAQVYHEAEERVPIYRPSYPYGGDVHPLPAGDALKALMP
jgi:citrate synthase